MLAVNFFSSAPSRSSLFIGQASLSLPKSSLIFTIISFLQTTYEKKATTTTQKKKRERGRGRSEGEKRKNVDKEATSRPTTCVFHGLMMHREAKQNRQQSIDLTHYMLTSPTPRSEEGEKSIALQTCQIKIAVKMLLLISQLSSKTTYSIISREAVTLTRIQKNHRERCDKSAREQR